MKDTKLEEALEYAESTNKIEDLNLNKEELEEIKKAIVDENKTDGYSFQYINVIKQKEKNDKTR